MKAYSLDLRQRVVAAVTEGLARAEVLRIFQISQSTLTRYLKQHRTSDSLVARPHAGGPQPAIPSTQHHALADLVAADPDATLAHLCNAWAQQTGVRVSQATMCRTLASIGLPRKKRV
jgi:transposase